MILSSQSKAVIVILKAQVLATSMLRSPLVVHTGTESQQQVEQMSMLGRAALQAATHRAAAMLVTWIQHTETGSTTAAARTVQAGQGRSTETATAHVLTLHRARSQLTREK